MEIAYRLYILPRLYLHTVQNRYLQKQVKGRKTLASLSRHPRYQHNRRSCHLLGIVPLSSALWYNASDVFLGRRNVSFLGLSASIELSRLFGPLLDLFGGMPNCAKIRLASRRRNKFAGLKLTDDQCRSTRCHTGLLNPCESEIFYSLPSGYSLTYPTYGIAKKLTLEKMRSPSHATSSRSRRC